MGMKRILWIPLCMLLLLFMVCSPAYAHKVMVFGYLEGDRVHLEGYFADGKKTGNSLVEVFDKGGHKLLEGKTDEQGVFTFPAPDVPEIRVVLTASMGHLAECSVELEKAKPSGKASSNQSDEPVKEAGRKAVAKGAAGNSEQKKPAEVPEAGPKSDNVTPGLTSVSEDRIRAIISEELDRKLAPVHREVTLLGQEKKSLPDIIGGIGYIAGIMGIIMYFKMRRGSSD